MDKIYKLYIETLIYELNTMAKTKARRNALFKIKSVVDELAKGKILIDKRMKLNESDIEALLNMKVVEEDGGIYYILMETYTREMNTYDKKRSRDWDTDVPYEMDRTKKLKVSVQLSHAYHRYPITESTIKAMEVMDKYMEHFKKEFGTDADSTTPTIGINPAIIKPKEMNELVRINVVLKQKNDYIVNWWNYNVTSELYQQRRDYIKYRDQLNKEEPEKLKEAMVNDKLEAFYYAHGLCSNCEFFPCTCS